MNARIGSISHGTLRTEDLLGTFSYELRGLATAARKQLIPDQASAGDTTLEDRHLRLCDEADALLALLTEEDEVGKDREWTEEEQEQADALAGEELPDALSEYAPDYCYFGTHQGDGSDFGFWPAFDSLEEDAHGRHASVFKVEAGDRWPREFEEAGKIAGFVVEGVGYKKFTWLAKAVLDDDGRATDAAWDAAEVFESEEEAWADCCTVNKLSPELPGQFNYVMEVNDHGNVTLYTRDGVECWSCV